MARLNNRIMEIQNSSMPLDKKKIEIDKVIAYMDNEKIVNDLVDTTMEFYKGDDEKTAKEYLKIQFEGETKTVLKGIKSQITEIQREEKRIEKERIDWAAAGDLDNYDKVEIFDKTQMTNLRRNITAQIESGKLLENEAKNLVRDYAEKLFVNDKAEYKELKINAFVKQYADTENPIPYIYGKQYPELYQAERVTKNSKGNNASINIKAPKKGFIGFFDDDGYKEWENVKKEFSSDPVYADAQLKSFIIGLMKDDGFSAKDINSTTMQPYLKKLSTEEGKRLIKANKILKSNKPVQNTKSNTVSTKKNKMGGYLR